jgi:hypothetical protein
MSLDTFRTETRAWLEANCPPAMRQPVRGEDDIVWGGRKAKLSPDQKGWLDAMASRGWTVPDWPQAYGGGGLSPEETKVLKQEMARLGCRNPLNSFGISMLGPAMLKYGTEEQKKRFLPPIARGEIRWCQGYSEPNAGSDLAGLQTSAEDKGDHFLVNGQKVWTSYADKADWIFCLVRTSKESKHNGISFLLFDMDSEGVSTRPILLISGNSPFCETFFDNVKVPKDQLVGELNKGWDVAKYLLGHEREMISGMGLGGGGLGSGGPAAPRPDRAVRGPRARLPRHVRKVHGRAEARPRPPCPAVDDEILRHRAEQGPLRAGHGRGRLGRARMGRRDRRRQGAIVAAHQGKLDRRRDERDPAQHRCQANTGAAWCVEKKKRDPGSRPG